MAHEISIDEIEATANTQVRHRLDARVIEEYAEAMQAGANFPALTVFAEKDSQRYILADGFHRLEAAKASGLAHFNCEVKRGGVRAALGHALGANDQHGLRRTNADKRNAVELALQDPKWCAWSNVDISRLCRVSDKTVARVREDLVLAGEIDDPETVMMTRKGKTVERKAGQSRSFGNPKEGKNREKSRPSKNSNSPKSSDQVNKDEVLSAIETIKLIPHDGAEAMRRWRVADFVSDFAYCRDWLDEAVRQCEDDAA